MSSQLKIEQFPEQDISPKKMGNKVLPGVDALLASSLAMMTASTKHLLEGSDGKAQCQGGSADPTTMYLLEEARKKTEREEHKQKEALEALKSAVSHAGGKDAIFESAGLISQLESKGQQNMIQMLQNQLKILQAQLAGLKAMEKFMEKFGQDYLNFLKDNSTANFNKVIADLKSKFANDPDIMKMLKDVQIDEFILKFFGKDLSFFQILRLVLTIGDDLNELEAKASGNPSLFQQVMKEGMTAFKNQIKDLTRMIENLEVMISIMEGKGMSAIFKMEAMLMSVEKTAIQNNSKQSEQQKKIGDAVIAGLVQTEKKLEKDLKKIEKAQHHHGGLLGFLKDIGKTIDKIAHEVADVVKNTCEGNFKAVGESLEKMTALKSVLKAMNEIMEGHVLQGFQSLATTALLCATFGPLGLVLNNTAVGKDLHDMVRLITDAFVALGEATAAGFLEATGDQKTANSLLSSAKKLGEDMLTNPALQTLADIAMVVVIVASVVAQQYWLAALMTVMLVMSNTGALHKGTDALADEISKIPGLSKAAAKVIADITVIALITALSFGAGSIEASGSVAVADAADSGSNAADEAAQNAASGSNSGGKSVAAEEVATNGTDSSKDAAESKSAWRRATESAGKRGGMTLLGFGSSLGMSSLGIDIAKAVDSKDKKLEIILMIIQEVVAAVSAIAGAEAMVSTEGLSGFDQKAQEGLRKIAPKLIQFLEENPAQIAKTVSQFMRSAIFIQGASKISQGGSKMLEGLILKNIEALKGEIALFNLTEKTNNDQIQQNSEHLKQTVKEFDEIIDTFNAPALAGEGIANALMGNA